MVNGKRLIYANDLVKELTDALEQDCNRYMYSYQKDERDARYIFAIDRINEAPTVDAVEVVHGRWLSYLDGEHIMPDVYFKCSKCGSRGHQQRWRYCPNCGAKMEGE